MYSVSPSDPEKFYLRLLLLHMPGARSYTDLLTVDGVICASFRDACVQRHLLADNGEYYVAIAEASTFQMPRQLQGMFATTCQPSDPQLLWTTHQEAHDAAVNLALHDIDRVLRSRL
jgi:hypothetical protein